MSMEPVLRKRSAFSVSEQVLSTIPLALQSTVYIEALTASVILMLKRAYACFPCALTLNNQVYVVFTPNIYLSIWFEPLVHFFPF